MVVQAPLAERRELGSADERPNLIGRLDLWHLEAGNPHPKIALDQRFVQRQSQQRGRPGEFRYPSQFLDLIVHNRPVLAIDDQAVVA